MDAKMVLMVNTSLGSVKATNNTVVWGCTETCYPKIRNAPNSSRDCRLRKHWSDDQCAPTE